MTSTADKHVALQGVAEMLGVSRQRAATLVNSKGFPEPFVAVPGARAWKRAAVVKWQKERSR